MTEPRRGPRRRGLPEITCPQSFRKSSKAPADLRDKQIAIRFDRARPTRVVVYYKDERIGEATELDLVANAHLKRGKGGSR